MTPLFKSNAETIGKGFETMKNAAFRLLDRTILPAVQKYLQDGLVVVLIGAAGSGKTLLAKKALPTAELITGLNGAYRATGEMGSDLIGEELFEKVPSDDFIRSMNQAIARGHKVIVTAQMWQDIVPYLAALEDGRYRVFDLNRVWEKYGRPYALPCLVPLTVLAN